MDILEHALYRIRAHDTRPLIARRWAAQRDAADVESLDHRQDDQRRAAARLVVDALSVLAACDGLAADVAAAVDDVLGAEQAPSGAYVRPALVHDTADAPDPHLGPVRGSTAADDAPEPPPGRYPPGPAGDRLAFLDAEHTDDD